MHSSPAAGRRYMIKSMSAAEHAALLQMLPSYCAHLHRHRNRSLIARVHGCYSIRMYGQTTYFFVMGNLFSGFPDLNEVYDLKGSWVDRHSKGRAGRTRFVLFPSSRGDGALLARGVTAVLQAVLPPSEDDEYASASVMQTEARLLQRLKDSQRASRARRCTSFSIAFALVGGGLALAITFVSLGLHNADCPECWAGIKG